jgi:hypothetical protein
MVLEYKRAAHDLLDQSPHTLHLRDASHFDVSVFLGQEITFTIATDSVEMRNSFKRAREEDEPTGLQDNILVKRAMVGRGLENVVANPLQAQQIFEDWGGQDPHNITSLNAGMELDDDSNLDPRETGTHAGTLASNICYGAVSSFLLFIRFITHVTRSATAGHPAWCLQVHYGALSSISPQSRCG